MNGGLMVRVIWMAEMVMVWDALQIKGNFPIIRIMAHARIECERFLITISPLIGIFSKITCYGLSNLRFRLPRAKKCPLALKKGGGNELPRGGVWPKPTVAQQ